MCSFIHFLNFLAHLFRNSQRIALLRHALVFSFHAIIHIFVLNTAIESLTRDNLEIARTGRETISGRRGTSKERKVDERRESFLRRFVRISRPRPDSNDWFYVETANGSGSKICRPNLPVSAASGPAEAAGGRGCLSLLSR